MRWLVIAIGTVVLGVAGLLGVALASGVGSGVSGTVGPNVETATSFTLPGIGGGDVRLLEGDGPVLVYFWASWCEPCRREAPAIQRLWPEYEARGYRFIGVNMLDAPDSALTFVRDLDLTFPLAHDGSGDVYLEYGVSGVPEAFFLGPDLAVRERFLGELSEEVLREKLDALQARPAGA